MDRREAVRGRDATKAAMRRRDWLAAAAAGTVAAAARPAWATQWQTKARKNLRLAVADNVYGKLPVDAAAQRIRADGFRSVLASYRFADVKFDPLKPDWAAAEKIVGTLANHEVAIASLYGYYNLVDPDAARRKQGEDRMQCLLTNWKRLGCAIVSTESGTSNVKSQWLESPENDTEEGFRQCKAAVERWARLAEETGAVLTIEAYWRNVIGSIERTERLLREIDSPALKLVMDPCNYYRREDLPQMQTMLRDMFRRLGPYIAVAHAKDVKPSANGTDLPAAGLGELDYPLYLQLLAELDRPIDLIVEHVKLDDVARARKFVLGQIEKLP